MPDCRTVGLVVELEHAGFKNLVLVTDRGYESKVLQVERSRIGLTLAIHCFCVYLVQFVLRLIRFCFFLPAAPVPR